MSSPRVCVFCGAGPGVEPEFVAAAEELGAALVAAGFGLVYGAGGVSVMGALSDAALTAGGEVVGVIPQSLVVEVLTWAQLGLHAKPIVVVDVAGYYAPLVALLDHALESGFLTVADRSLVRVVPSVPDAVAALSA